MGFWFHQLRSELNSAPEKVLWLGLANGHLHCRSHCSYLKWNHPYSTDTNPFAGLPCGPQLVEPYLPYVHRKSVVLCKLIHYSSIVANKFRSSLQTKWLKATASVAEWHREHGTVSPDFAAVKKMTIQKKSNWCPSRAIKFNSVSSCPN